MTPNDCDGMIVETTRLRIRKLTIEDAEFVFRLVNEPSFLANIGDKGVRNLEDAKRFILEGPWTGQQQPGWGQFAVVPRSSGKAWIGLHNLFAPFELSGWRDVNRLCGHTTDGSGRRH